MGIRQKLNENPVAASAVTGVIIVACLGIVFWQMWSGGSGGRVGATKQYFTVDDGKNWFPAEARNVPPFQHEGKTAYRVKVYRCPDGKEFVSHLERYNEADRKKLQEALDKAQATKSAVPPGAAILPEAMEVKKPGDKDWVKWTPKTSDRYRDIQTPTCPSGSSEGVQLVLPR